MMVYCNSSCQCSVKTVTSVDGSKEDAGRVVEHVTAGSKKGVGVLFKITLALNMPIL